MSKTSKKLLGWFIAVSSALVTVMLGLERELALSTATLIVCISAALYVVAVKCEKELKKHVIVDEQFDEIIGERVRLGKELHFSAYNTSYYAQSILIGSMFGACLLLGALKY